MTITAPDLILPGHFNITLWDDDLPTEVRFTGQADTAWLWLRDGTYRPISASEHGPDDPIQHDAVLEVKGRQTLLVCSSTCQHHQLDPERPTIQDPEWPAGQPHGWGSDTLRLPALDAAIQRANGEDPA